MKRQEELRDAFVAKHDLDLDSTLRDIGVSAYTGENRERGALAEFLRRVDAGQIPLGSFLLVESLDRLSRSAVLDALELFISIINRGVTIVTLADGCSYSRQSAKDNWTQLIISISVMARAHEESAMKAHRLRKAWASKRQNGGVLTARAPSWLCLQDGRFEPIPARVAVVRRIFEELADGIGRDAIASRLNQDAMCTRKAGVPDSENPFLPWGHGRQWHGGTVQKITDTQAVIGNFQPHRLDFYEDAGVRKGKRVAIGEPITGYFPRIIDDALWTRARASAASRVTQKVMNSGGRKGTKFTNIFSGVARCATCGQPMNYRDRGPRSTPVLRCSGERNGACSNNFRLAYHRLEDIVLTTALTMDEVDPQTRPNAISQIESELAVLHSQRDDLQHQGELIVDEVGRGSRFAIPRLAALELGIEKIDAEIETVTKQLTATRAALDPQERVMALKALFNLEVENASDQHRYKVRAHINHVLKIHLTTMLCYDDGAVKVTCQTGEQFLYRDGRCLMPDGVWLPSAYSMFGLFPHRRA